MTRAEYDAAATKKKIRLTRRENGFVRVSSRIQILNQPNGRLANGSDGKRKPHTFGQSMRLLKEGIFHLLRAPASTQGSAIYTRVMR